MEYYIGCGRALPILFKMIDAEVAKTESPTQLFRLDSIATKFLVAFLNVEGGMWLKLSFGSLVASLVKNSSHLEVDGSRLADGVHLHLNQVTLQGKAREFLDTILNLNDTCPKTIRDIARRISTIVSRKFFGSEVKAVGGILFLRIICPSLVSPQNMYLQAPPSPETFRGLVLLTKIVQNVANGVTFGSKEQYMVPFNNLVEEYVPKLTTFLLEISSPILESAAPIVAEKLTLHVVMRATDEIIDHLGNVLNKAPSAISPSAHYDLIELKKSVMGFLPLIKQQRDYETGDHSGHSH
jgi:neurofibromin 1